jgi:large subunit ribosomal protein L29
MKAVKASELRQLSAAELKEKIAGMEEEMFNLRFQSSMGQSGNPLRARTLRREVARAKTVLGQVQGRPASVATAKAQG